MQSGCQDNVVLKQGGNARPGYPVLLETTFDSERGAFTLKQEATEVSNATLDAALFDIPAGYREVKTSQELMGFGGFGATAGAGGLNQGDLQARIDAAKRAAAQAQGGEPEEGSSSKGEPAAAPAAKKAGSLRIGVLRVTGDTAGQTNLQNQLAGELHSLGADAVALISDPDDLDSIRKEAAEKQCDYVMNTAITEFSQGGTAKKLGGLLSGGGFGLGKKSAPTATYEVKDTVRVYNPANSEAQSVTGENDYKDSTPEATFGGLLKAQARQALMQIRKLRAQ
jgi:hypothetical protein